MKSYFLTAWQLLRKPRSLIDAFPEDIDGLFWIKFLGITFIVTQIGVMLDVVFVSGRGWAQFGMRVFENGLLYSLTPVLLYAVVRMFGGKGRFAQSLRIVSCAYNANMLAIIISPALAMVQQSGIMESGARGDFEQSFFVAISMLFYMTYLYAGRLFGAYYRAMEKTYGFGFFKNTAAGILTLALCVLVMGVILAMV